MNRTHILPTCLIISTWAYRRMDVYYSPYAKVLVKTKTTPKNTIFAIFELLYLSHHNIPTIENLVANTQLILEQLETSIY